MKRKYRESEVPALVASLSERFEAACATYKLALSTRASNRSKKELVRGNSRGTSIHKFQVNFSWLLLDITRGPRCQIDDRLRDADDLIAHINKISNT